MRVYIAGPIAGYPDGNKIAFQQAAQRLMELGHTPVDPHLIPTIHDGMACIGTATGREKDPHLDGCYYRTDIIFMLMTCEAIVMLPGWEDSKGATLERAIADTIGFQVIELA